MKPVRLAFYLTAVLNLIVLAGLVYWGVQNTRYQTPQDTVILVPPGAGVRQIAASLEEAGVVKNRYFFEAYARFSKQAGTLKIGEYEFHKGNRLERVLEKLVKGKTKKYKMTFPEGRNVRDLCRVMVSRLMIDIITCLNLVSDTTLIREHAASAETLEGYLFPDTYTYDALTTQAEFIDSMVHLFFKKLGQKRVEKIRTKGMTVHDAVILASIVEKETGQKGERAQIAAVFLNRLKMGMPLQSDPTVIYRIDPFDGNLTKDDLQRDTPYNTYTRKGLPAGPICNPGMASIDAVLHPATTEALYFVAKGDGSHYFSKSLEEHNRAVQYYQLKRGEPPSPTP